MVPETLGAFGIDGFSILSSSVERYPDSAAFTVTEAGESCAFPGAAAHRDPAFKKKRNMIGKVNFLIVLQFGYSLRRPYYIRDADAEGLV